MGDAVPFCVRYGIQQAVRFSTVLYGSEGAATCSNYWCRKLSVFLQLWVDSGAADYPFTDEDVRAWEEPREFTDLVAAVTARAAQTRFAQLRSCAPCAPESRHEGLLRPRTLACQLKSLVA